MKQNYFLRINALLSIIDSELADKDAKDNAMEELYEVESMIIALEHRNEFSSFTYDWQDALEVL